MMRNKLLFWLSGFLPVRFIDVDGRPYLERYYVGQLFGVTFYLHRFVRSDSERNLHNHPWGWGHSLVLRGGYDEEVLTDLVPHVNEAGGLVEIRTVRFWNRINGNYFHRIVGVAPGTWTLFFHGPRKTIRLGSVSANKGWGFIGRVDLGGGLQGTLFTPFTASPGPGWHVIAPRGRHTKRMPL